MGFPSDGAGRAAMRGRLARQAGTRRDGWRTSIDGPSASDLAMVRGWLMGWDDEDLRIRAGGRPMDAATREAMAGDLAFAASMGQMGAKDGDGLEAPIDVDGADMARLLALAGCADPEGAAVPGTEWRVEPAMLRSFADAARRRAAQALHPHRA